MQRFDWNNMQGMPPFSRQETRRFDIEPMSSLIGAKRDVISENVDI